jgi:hypothetical protein
MKTILFGSYSIADLLHASELSFPISIGHTFQDIEKVSEVIRSTPRIYGMFLIHVISR